MTVLRPRRNRRSDAKGAGLIWRAGWNSTSTVIQWPAVGVSTQVFAAGERDETTTQAVAAIAASARASTTPSLVPPKPAIREPNARITELQVPDRPGIRPVATEKRTGTRPTAKATATPLTAQSPNPIARASEVPMTPKSSRNSGWSSIIGLVDWDPSRSGRAGNACINTRLPFAFRQNQCFSMATDRLDAVIQRQPCGDRRSRPKNQGDISLLQRQGLQCERRARLCRMR